MAKPDRDLPDGVTNILTDEDKVSRPLFKDGKFGNPWPEWKQYQMSPWDILKMRAAKIPSKEVLDKELPTHKPTWSAIKNPPEGEIQITWIGHSTFFIQMDGVNFLTDPIWSQRASPSALVGPKRYRQVPCKISELPKIDFVVLSHDHFDHLDHFAVTQIRNKAQWIIPLGLGKWFKGHGVSNFIELQWWEQYNFNDKVKITFAPAMHWSTRGPGTERKSLWGSYSIKGKSKSVWFAGDTGYADFFKEIGNTLGPFDLAIIPIGAYEPRKLFRGQHINPAEAVQIHTEVKAKKSVGCHWGTFVLTAEPILQPREDLEVAKKDQGVDKDAFITLEHGATSTI